MKITASMVLLAFMAMALLSFVVMDAPVGSGGMSGCLATKIHNGVCPPETSAVDAAAFHTSAFSAFSLAIVVSLAASFLLSAARLLASNLAPFFLPIRFQDALAVAPKDFPAVRKDIRALALFEHSPTE